jgi:hypothetical protein
LNTFEINSRIAFCFFHLSEQININIRALRPQNPCERRAVAAVVAFAAKN